MPGDPIESLGRELADLRRRISALETAPRANLTTVANGQTRWLDANGDESVAIGTDDLGDSFIRIMNGDGTAPAFEVRQGLNTFPLAASAWQAEYEYSGMDAAGRRTTTDTLVFLPMFSVVLSLVTPRVRYSLSPFTSGLVTEGQMRFFAVGLDARSTGVGAQQVGSTITFDDSYPNVHTATLTIPATILASGYTDVVGSLVRLWVETKITAGTGTIALAAVDPAYCV